MNIFLAGMAITVLSVGRTVMDFPSGLLADRVGRKPLMVIGTILIALCAFLNASTDNFALFLFYRFIQGVGASMWMTSRTTLLADILKPKERGRVLGYFQSFQLLGQAAGPAIGGFVSAYYGLKSNFYFYAALGVVSLVITCLFIKETSSGKTHGGGFVFPRELFSSLLRSRGFVLASLACAASYFLMSGVRQTILPVYVSEAAGLGPAEIGVILSVATLANFFLTIPIGYGLDSLGRKPIIVLSFVTTGISLLLFPQVSSFLLLCLVSFLMGVGTSGMQQAPLVVVADVTSEESRGASMGIFSFFSDVGSLLGPLVLGLVADGFGLSAPFYVMGGIVFLVAALSYSFGVETLSGKSGD